MPLETAPRVDAPPPQSVADLIRIFGKLLPGNVVAVSLYTADEGVALDGQMVRDLPASAIDKLQNTARTNLTSTFKVMARTVAPTPRVISGAKSVLVKVARKKQ